MTHCVAIKLNAGLDQTSTFRKMIVDEKPDDRFRKKISTPQEKLI